jgi:hypothetical protein
MGPQTRIFLRFLAIFSDKMEKITALCAFGVPLPAMGYCAFGYQHTHGMDGVHCNFPVSYIYVRYIQVS